MVLGKSVTHQVLYASQRSLLVGLWVRAHRCLVGVSTQVGAWGDYVMNCYGLTISYKQHYIAPSPHISDCICSNWKLLITYL